jgi:transposase
VIRVSQWAEIRHMHIVDGVPKKELARRFGLDVKTIRRAVGQEAFPAKRYSPLRGRSLDPYRDEIVAWLKAEPRLSAKRIGRLLEEKAGFVPERTVRQYVATIRAETSPKEAFVHRTHAPGDTMEVDFGMSLARVAGRLQRIHFLVATLPASNGYFAKGYLVERLECLLDGILEAFRWFGGLTRRVVLDNTSLAVREVLKGSERAENRAFQAFRGALPVEADFCAPRKGNEKGSVERGVAYVRNNCFRPMPEVTSLNELNGEILEELVKDQDRRRLPDGRSIVEALLGERECLRPIPLFLPDPCRTLSRVADKFGHVRLDGVMYSIPIRQAYRSVLLKAFCDRIEIVAEGEVIAVHARSFERATSVLDPLHVLSLLEMKHRAVPESTAIQQWKLPEIFHDLRAKLRSSTRHPDKEWISILRLLETHPIEEVEPAVAEALDRGSARLETVRMVLRQRAGHFEKPTPLAVPYPELASIDVLEPELSSYDALVVAGEEEVSR